VIAAAALAVVLLPVSIASLLLQSQEPLPWRGLAIALFALLHAASFVAARSPRVAFAAASAAMLILVAIPTGDVTPALYPSALAFLLCLGQVAAQCGRRDSLAALGVGLLGSGIVAVLAVGFADPVLRVGALIGFAGANAAAWAFGALERTRRIRVEERAVERAEQAVLAERGRISRDLHDVVAHAVTVMIAQADVARMLLAEDARASERALDVVTRTGREALRGMRGIVSDGAPLRPAPDLAAVRALVDDARSPQVRIGLDERGEPGGLASPGMLALHHVVREALTNAIRHAEPPVRIKVGLGWESGRVVVVVTDDGGARPRDLGLGTGTGLVGLAERVRLAGGELTAGPVGRGDLRAGSGGGWQVRAELPRDAPAGATGPTTGEDR